MTPDGQVDLFELTATAPGRESSNAAYLPRPDGNPKYLPYGQPGMPRAVFVRRQAVDLMRKIALSADPNETIGVLLGRTCQDRDGEYTLVVGVEHAMPGEHEGNPGSVRIPASGRSMLKNRAAQNWPGWDDVGWYHTHPNSAPRFSQTDLVEQSTLLPNQVGIVASVRTFRNPDGTDPLGVYLGPAGRRLVAEMRPASEHAQLPTSVAPQVPLAIAEPAVPPANMQRKPPEFRKRLAFGALALVMMLAVVQVVGSVWLHNGIRGNHVETMKSIQAVETNLTKSTGLIVPTVLATRSCKAGEQFSLNVRVPVSISRGLTVVAPNTQVAEAEFSPRLRELTITCIAPGRGAVELRSDATGAAVSIPLYVHEAAASSYPVIGSTAGAGR